MRINSITLVLIFVLVPSCYKLQGKTNNNNIVTNYRSTFIPARDAKGNLQILWRLFNQHNKLWALLVDPYTLETSRCDFTNLDLRNQAIPRNILGYFTWQELENTPYISLLKHSTSPPYKFQNDGLKSSSSKLDGCFLTIDMCPSKNKFEESFFKKLINYGNIPFEVGISISGLWLLKHPQEFAWLCQQNKEGKLKITWINHTFSHLYYKDLPLEKNFMRFSLLDPEDPSHDSLMQASFQEEEMLSEQLLVENDQLPSVFFRFPGLISNANLMSCLRILGLIPLGSEAWLAKGEEPKPGSIVLVHGNGNEKLGIVKVNKLLDTKNIKWLSLAHLSK